MTRIIVMDHLSTRGKQNLIIACTTVGVVLSHLSYGLRIFAKKRSIGRLQLEDWIMGVGLLLTIPNIVCEYYGSAKFHEGLTVGVGAHAPTLTKQELMKMNLSIWIIQRFQQISLFFVKTSIILFYVRLFPTPTFKKFAWGIWIYTLLWTIGASFATLFECTPIDYFWNKSNPKGHCVSLTTLGFANGFLSFLGDLFILCMPIRMIWNLHMNLRRKIALMAIFLCGLFVVCISIIRLIALFTIDPKDASFTQVQPGLWTYLEVALGITCGNLPLLYTIFNRYFSSGTSSSNKKSGSYDPNRPRTHFTKYYIKKTHSNDRFDLMTDRSVVMEENVGYASDVELQDRGRRYEGDGINVTTKVELSVRENTAEEANKANL